MYFKDIQRKVIINYGNANLILIKKFPTDIPSRNTRRRFNVYKTSMWLHRRRIDVLKTLVASRVYWICPCEIFATFLFVLFFVLFSYFIFLFLFFEIMICFLCRRQHPITSESNMQEDNIFFRSSKEIPSIKKN